MYKKTPNGWLKHWDFILLDVFCAHLAFVIAFWLRQGFGNPYAELIYREAAIFMVLTAAGICFFLETMKNVLKRGVQQELLATVRQVLLVEMLTTVYLFATKNAVAYSRIVLFTSGILYFIFSYIVRLGWKSVLKKSLLTGSSSSLLVVTISEQVHSVLKKVDANNFNHNWSVSAAIIDKNMVGDCVNDIPVVADLDTVAYYVCREWIDEVLLVLPSDYDLLQPLLDRLSETGVTVHLALTQLKNTSEKKQFVENLGGYTVITTAMNSITVQQAFFKRSLDILGGLVGCFITLILIVVIGPIIYLKSPGPIFFSQTRIGKNGKKFKMYKFRSMYMDAEKRKKELVEQNRISDGLMFKVDFDPRIIGNQILENGERKTGIGQFIRSTSLDEFPQFFNVLKGDMSLVGTRPPTEDEWNAYKLHHHARLVTKPGITGMWQVSGRSDITDFEEVVKLDTRYINEWSIGLDLKILFKTVLTVLKREGSM